MARCSEATSPGRRRRQARQGRWDGDDSELDVFAAERYFNGDDALWCAGSSSSFSSAFRTGATHERDRSVATAAAATSSSEASWNSRSALLPDGKVLAAAARSVVEPEPRGTGSNRHRAKPSPPPSSHLRRWLLGAAGCACIGGDGDESASADDLYREEVEDGNVVDIGGKRLLNGSGELFQGAGSKELAVVEAAYLKVRPGRWLDDEDEFLAGEAAFDPVQVQLAGDDHHGAANPSEFSTPISKPETSAALREQRRKSCDMLWPVGGTGSALASTKQDSAFTIVAGNTSRGGGLRAAAGGGGVPAAHGRPCVSRCDSSDDDNDTAPSEPWCAYPPSEASVVWSVVTAEGAASCNFSSAASGYYYHLNGGEGSALRHAAGRSDRRRRGGVTNSVGLLTCMGDTAVNAVGPARRRHGVQSGGRGAHSGYPDMTCRR